MVNEGGIGTLYISEKVPRWRLEVMKIDENCSYNRNGIVVPTC